MASVHPDPGYPRVKPGPRTPRLQRRRLAGGSRPFSLSLPPPGLIRSSKPGEGCVPLPAGAPSPQPLPSLRPRLVRAPGADGCSSRAEPRAPLHSHSGEGNRGNGGGGAAARERGRGERETRSPLSLQEFAGQVQAPPIPPAPLPSRQVTISTPAPPGAHGRSQTPPPSPS